MTEALLLWGKCACMALHITALIVAVVGAILLGSSCEQKNRKGIKAGLWMLAVSIFLIVAIPWPPAWDAWIEMARRTG